MQSANPDPGNSRKPGARERLLMAAEQMLTDRNLDQVGIKELHAAANQKNTSAINYHFGGKEGLVLALVKPRLELVNDRRLQRLAQLERSGNTELREHVAALA